MFLFGAEWFGERTADEIPAVSWCGGDRKTNLKREVHLLTEAAKRRLRLVILVV